MIVTSTIICYFNINNTFKKSMFGTWQGCQFTGYLRSPDRAVREHVTETFGNSCFRRLLTHITCCRFLLGKGAELSEPPQPLRGPVTNILLPYYLRYLHHSLLQPLPELLRQCRRQGQLSTMHLRHGATGREGEDGEGRGVDQSCQQGVAGGYAQCEGRHGL